VSTRTSTNYPLTYQRGYSTVPAVSDFQKALGVKIAEARKAKGLKQKELAAMLGVEVTTISRWETGWSGIPLFRLGDIAAALDVTASDLLEGIEVAAV